MSAKQKIQQLTDLLKHHPGCETKPMYQAVITQTKRLSEQVQLKLF